MSVSPTCSTAATAVAEADSRVTRDLQPQVRVLFTRRADTLEQDDIR